MADLATSTPVREPQPQGWYATAATAAHLTHCTDCHTRDAEADARAAANSESIHRRDRTQLGLRITPNQADEALRRVREGRPAGGAR